MTAPGAGDDVRDEIAEALWLAVNPTGVPWAKASPSAREAYPRWADALLPVVSAIADQRAADAWDEGYAAAEHDALYRPYSDQPAAATWKPIPNPYRAALTPPATDERSRP